MNRFHHILATAVIFGATSPAASHADPALTWSEQKCTLYSAAWAEALLITGRDGLTQDFLEAHHKFLASGCHGRGNVCPITAEELELADLLALMAVSEGMAGSFLPFVCRS